MLPNKDGEIQNVNISCIEEVLNIDVINFWNIEGCQTQLKRKIYKESVEYKQRYQQLKKYRNDLLSWQFYYLIKLDGDYDITHKGFPVILDAYEGSVPNIPNYLTKNSLCFDYASSRFPKHKISRSRYFGGSDYFVTQKIYLSVPNEKDALKIENTRSKALLIIFKLDSAFRANPSGLWNRTYLKTKIQSLYIVDTQTEEILAKVL